jgi:hypothetical protein
MNKIEMIEEFQCPGCVGGCDTKCGQFKEGSCNGCFYCSSHVLGTMVGLGNSIALGLPTGFNKPGVNFENSEYKVRNQINVRLWIKGTKPEWDHLNVPVWAMEKDGFLFVRTYAPRIGNYCVDVIEGLTLDDMDQGSTVINVADFIDEID